VASAMGWSPGLASSMVDTAVDVVTELPELLWALAGGRSSCPNHSEGGPEVRQARIQRPVSSTHEVPTITPPSADRALTRSRRFLHRSLGVE